jgi:hypothetical protein
MSTFKRHCQESEELFGEAFEEVHFPKDEEDYIRMGLF